MIEVTSDTPHLETSLEVALRYATEGRKVQYFHIGAALPFAEGMKRTNFPLVLRLLGSISPVIRAKSILETVAAERALDLSFDLVDEVRGILDPIRLTDNTTIKDLSAVQWRGGRLGLSVVSSLVSLRRDPNIEINSELPMIDLLTSTYQSAFIWTTEVLRRQNFSAVVVFNGRFAATRAIADASELLNIPVLFHERGATAYRYFLESYRPHDRDMWRDEIKSTWDSMGPEERRLAMRTGEEFFAKRRNGDGIGWKSFVDHQDYSWNRNEQFIVEKPRRKRLVAYFSSSEDEFVATDPFGQNSRFNSQFDAVNCLIDECERRGDLCVVRVHPHVRDQSENERLRWLQFASQRESMTTKFISCDSPIKSYEILDDADLVFCWASTIGAEATFSGKPSFSFAEGSYDNETVRCLNSCDEISRVLDEKVPQIGSYESALSYGYYRMTFGFEFNFYRPISLTRGFFLGVDLQYEPIHIRILRRLWARWKRVVHR